MNRGTCYAITLTARVSGPQADWILENLRGTEFAPRSDRREGDILYLVFYCTEVSSTAADGTARSLAEGVFRITGVRFDISVAVEASLELGPETVGPDMGL